MALLVVEIYSQIISNKINRQCQCNHNGAQIGSQSGHSDVVSSYSSLNISSGSIQSNTSTL